MLGDIAGHGNVSMDSCSINCLTILALCGLALSSMDIVYQLDDCFQNEAHQYLLIRHFAMLPQSLSFQVRGGYAYSHTKIRPKQWHHLRQMLWFQQHFSNCKRWFCASIRAYVRQFYLRKTCSHQTNETNGFDTSFGYSNDEAIRNVLDDVLLADEHSVI